MTTAIRFGLYSLCKVAAIFCVFASGLRAQTAKPFYIWVDGGVGYTRSISALVQPTATPGADYTNGGMAAFVRVRGSRSTFITVGLETGWMHLSSVRQQNAGSPGFANTDITGSLNAIPVMGTATVQDYGFQLHGSIGFYRLISYANLFANTVSSGVWDMAFSLALAGELRLSNDDIILPEFRWTRINDEGKSLIALTLRFEFPQLQPF